MVELRLKGPQIASDLGAVSASAGAADDSIQVPSFLKPSALTGLPRISDGFDTDTLTLDTTGLTGITAYDWRIAGGATQGTAPTLSGAGLGGQWIECAVTCDQGTLVAPAVMVYASSHMGMTMAASHMTDDRAVVALVPHAEMTHIALADGNWNDTTIWAGGKVPKNGACVLIPHGVTVTYNEADRYRLDRVRVDGTLTWALGQSTYMLVETMVGTRGSSIIIGTSSNRVPAAYTHEIIVSGKDYSTNSYVKTELQLARDARLWGRGIVSQGLWRMWGTEKRTWGYADPIDAGATSLTMRDTPTGWQVGDTIVIAGTYVNYPGGGHPLTVQDEERVITGVNGNAISWSGGLTHPHKNQLAGSTRTDLYPVVMLKRGKNIIIRSEEPDVWYMRGHTACVHHHARVDMWDVEFRDLGRTNKSIATPAGVIDDSGTFKIYDEDSGDTVFVTPENTSNLQSRYPVHLHHVGFDHMGARPIVSDCYVEGTPGHAMVHHACDADMFNNAMYQFYGAGMVSESGNELGAWVGNLALHALYDGVSDGTRTPKIREGLRGLRGDNARFGYGFFMRGRAMRVNRNVAASVFWGYVFYHRWDANPAKAVAQPINLDARTIDLRDLNRPKGYSDGATGYEQVKFVHYPIIHFADNEAIATVTGFFVTKDNPRQLHDVNIKLKRFKSWGYFLDGAEVEYVGVYILDSFDCVAGPSGKNGIRFGANLWQVGTYRGRFEGNSGRSIKITTDEPNQPGNTDQYTVDNPRWFNIGTDSLHPAEEDWTAMPGTKTFDEVRFKNEDWDGTRIDYDASPSYNFPLEVGTWNGSNFGSMLTTMSNSDGTKTDNLSTTAPLAPKPVENEHIFCLSNTELRGLKRLDGWYDYGGNETLVNGLMISDRITGRPAKYLNMYRATSALDPENGPGLQGTFTYSATPVTVSDVTATVAENGSVVVDVLTDSSPSGGGGAGTYSLDNGSFIAPDHGVAELDYGTNEVIYTPDRNYTGTDEMYVFVYSQGQYGTVRITFLIGAGGSVSTPVADTDFSVADGGGQSINITLNEPPACGGRRIELVQYSTDEGGTWRRLCNRWVQAVHNITVASDGTAIAAGNYSLRVRYRTDYDFTTSAASAADPVTVT